MVLILSLLLCFKVGIVILLRLYLDPTRRRSPLNLHARSFEGPASPHSPRSSVQSVRIWPRRLSPLCLSIQLRSHPSRHHHTAQPSPAFVDLAASACPRCRCAAWKCRNALCGFHFIARRIEGLAETIVLKIKWLWPFWFAIGSLPFALREPPVLILVSQAQLVEGILSARL